MEARFETPDGVEVIHERDVQHRWKCDLAFVHLLEANGSLVMAGEEYPLYVTVASVRMVEAQSRGMTAPLSAGW